MSDLDRCGRQGVVEQALRRARRILPVADVVLSQPHDAKGAFLPLHTHDTALDGGELRGSLDASRRHLTAALDGRLRHREAARASMIRLAHRLNLLRRAEA